MDFKVQGLKYIDINSDGIHRVGLKERPKYLYPNGSPVKNPTLLKRIKGLVLPPAWKKVWICPVENGHIQAVGWDERNRKQYKYHTHWREVRDQNKYNKMVDFGKALPKIRKQMAKDLSQPGLSKAKVVATIVRLLQTSLIRVGNEEYAKTNKSFGLTTLKNRHVQIKGKRLHFEFMGKSRKQHSIEIEAPYVAHIVKKCQELPGQELFQYLDSSGVRHSVDSSDVNEYLQQIAGNDFTAKDFRTWAGTVLAARALFECESSATQTQIKKNIVKAIETVSERLGNTKAICRKCYVHPILIERYQAGDLKENLKFRGRAETLPRLHQLSAEENAVLVFLEKAISTREQNRPRLHKKRLH